MTTGRAAALIASIVLLAAFSVSATIVLLGRTSTLTARLSQDTTQLAKMREELTTDQALLVTLRKPATAGHLGVCFAQGFDNATGDVLYADVTTPDDSGGVPSCPSGAFISVVPGNTGH